MPTSCKMLIARWQPLQNADQTLQAIKIAIYETSVTWEVSKIFWEIRRLLYNLC